MNLSELFLSLSKELPSAQEVRVSFDIDFYNTASPEVETQFMALVEKLETEISATLDPSVELQYNADVYQEISEKTPDPLYSGSVGFRVRLRPEPGPED